jgi:hypothetical protein
MFRRFNLWSIVAVMKRRNVNKCKTRFSIFFIIVVEFVSKELIFSIFQSLKYLLSNTQRSFLRYSSRSQFTKFSMSLKFDKREVINFFFSSKFCLWLTFFTISWTKFESKSRSFLIYFKTTRVLSIMKESRLTRENFCFSLVLNFLFTLEFEICIFSIEFDFCSFVEFELCSSFCDWIDEREVKKWRTIRQQRETYK